MPKAIIDLWQEVPNCCANCPMLDTRWRNRKEIDFCECRLRRNLWINPYTIHEGKPDWCPMKEVKDGCN